MVANPNILNTEGTPVPIIRKDKWFITLNFFDFEPWSLNL